MRTPSKAQKQAIIHLRGPALVCAGPGSGKTFTIIRRILYLIEQYHINPDKILVITYTKAAAREMKERFETASAYHGVCFGTFHSICFNILRQSGVVSADSLIKENDKRKLFGVILGNQGLSSKKSYDAVTTLQNTVSRLKNMPEAEIHNAEAYGFSIDEILAVKKEYERFLREQGLIDFDDMVTECLQLLIKRPDICRKYQQMFSYLLVDEFQDINQPQYQILKLLAAPENNLFTVGDDDQAIYGFRGASPHIMKQFLEDFPEAGRMMLTENYRSGGSIVELAQKVIVRNEERFEKDFHAADSGGNVSFSCFDTRGEEENHLIRELSLLENDALYHTAIILRTNREVIQYTQLLEAAGIKVKKTVSKENIFQSFMMEDIEAFLSYLYFGKKRCDLIRFMNKPNRFFSREALPAERVLSGDMEWYYAKNPEMLSEIRSFFGKLQIAEKLSPYLAIAFFRKNLGYDDYLYGKAGNMAEFQRLSGQAAQIQKSFEEYKTGMPLPEFKRIQEEKAGAAHVLSEKQGVSIMTMHGSKGLEFERVYLPDINEGIIPSRDIQTKKEHEEERRLLYVAITRAKNDLYIYYTKERNRKPSRYLEGLIPPP